MESSAARSWEAAFSLPDSSRESALRISRFRNRHPSMDVKRHNSLLACRTSISDTNTAESSCKNAKSFNFANVVDGGYNEAKNGPEEDVSVNAEPVHQIRTQSNREKPGTQLTSKVNDSCCKPVLPTSTSQPHQDLLRKSPNSSNSQSAICLDADRIDADTAASTIQKSVSLPTSTSRKRTKFQTEVIHSTSSSEKLPACLQAKFFQCDALELAPKLLGKFLRRDDVVIQITEVEAYRPNDSACHGRFGLTPRTAAMFGPGGHAYVYLCYGLHVMLNIVADIEGVGAAVLIRSCAPIAGLQTIQSRRGTQSSKPVLLTGPGKVGQALGLTTDWSNHPLYMSGGLELLDGPPPESILVGPRVGIDYANPEDVKALWRFAIAGSPWISAPRNNLAPLKDSS